MRHAQSSPYWIQHADFSAEDFSPVDLNGAIQAFESHDWAEELRLARRLERAREENCPPGIGFVPGDRILQICPGSEGSALVFYQFKQAYRFLGLFRRMRDVNATHAEFPLAEARELIRRFYDRDHEWLIRRLDDTKA